ncbi:hypothetical protein AB6V29_01470 [Microbacterium sp. 20-116]|uniref:hypothetical protein n=1 Tax=Microbacterium sp. 20-116 TaxID=3239883 RepID=UPI0034E2EF50
MAGQQAPQTEEQKAAAAKAAAEKAAKEQAEAASAAEEAEAARAAEAEKATEGLQVIGPVAVLPLKSGGERYVYRGTPVNTKEFTSEGIEHAKAIGLVGTSKK